MSTYSFQHLAETAEIVQKLMVFSVGGGNVEKNVSPNLISALQYAKEDACCVVRPLTLKLSLRTRKHFKQSSGTYLSEAQPDRELFNAPFDVYLDEFNVFQPDIIIVLNERLEILTEEGAEGAPELVVEILSPKTRRWI
jgi:hypothetical protein